MKEGDVVLTPLPQATGAAKARPALVLRQMPPFGDCLLCGLSTQLQQEVKGFDEVIAASDADFAQSGLKADSLVRLGFLVVLPKSKLLGVIGSVDPTRH
jgi:mRNA interferase MazF